MEDRYLFKAKRVDNGKWAIGYYGVIGKRNVIIEKYAENYYCPDTCESRHGNQIHEVNSKTICQCTGLKDKNGKLIWENDIASYSDLITRDKKIICIEWNKMQASFVRKYRSPMGLQYLYLDEYIASRMEVIGNIFDNPELL